MFEYSLLLVFSRGDCAWSRISSFGDWSFSFLWSQRFSTSKCCRNGITISVHNFVLTSCFCSFVCLKDYACGKTFPCQRSLHLFWQRQLVFVVSRCVACVCDLVPWPKNCGQKNPLGVSVLIKRFAESDISFFFGCVYFGYFPSSLSVVIVVICPVGLQIYGCCLTFYEPAPVDLIKTLSRKIADFRKVMSSWIFRCESFWALDFSYHSWAGHPCDGWFKNTDPLRRHP